MRQLTARLARLGVAAVVRPSPVLPLLLVHAPTLLRTEALVHAHTVGVEPRFKNLCVVPGVIAFTLAFAHIGPLTFLLALVEVVGEPGNVAARGAGDAHAPARPEGTAEPGGVAGGGARRAVVGILGKGERICSGYCWRAGLGNRIGGVERQSK